MSRSYLESVVNQYGTKFARNAMTIANKNNEQWCNIKVKAKGVTFGSLVYWAKEDDPVLLKTMKIKILFVMTTER